MKSCIIPAMFAMLACAAPAFAGSQVQASPGVTLDEAAKAKFNREARGDDRQPIVVPVAPSGHYEQLAATAGLSPDEAETMSLAEIFVAKINHEGSGDEQQMVRGSAGTTMGTRSTAAPTDRTQLIAVAGLSASEAAGMSVSQIAAAKFARDTSTGDH